jgi:hypothetical protein
MSRMPQSIGWCWSRSVLYGFLKSKNGLEAVSVVSRQY